MPTPEQHREVFFIVNLGNVVEARRYGLNTALVMGFHQAEATKVAVVISELARNIERYVGVGTVSVISHQGTDCYIEIIAEDRGSGIKDLDRVLSGIYASRTGLGLGLAGSKRLMDEFEIQSATGKGTKVRAVKYLR